MLMTYPQEHPNLSEKTVPGNPGTGSPTPPPKGNPLAAALSNLAVGAVLFAAVCVMEELGKQTDAQGILHVLADGFCIAGILLLCVYGLRRLSRAGMFFGLGYAGSYCLQALLPINAAGKSGKAKNYHDWCEGKREKIAARPRVPLWQLFVGLGYLAVGVVLTVAYLFVS